MISGALKAIVLLALSYALRTFCGFAVNGTFGGAFGLAVTRSTDVAALVIPFAVYAVFRKKKEKKALLPTKYPVAAMFFSALLLSDIGTYIERALYGFFGTEIYSSDILSLPLGELAVYALFSVLIVPAAEEFVFRDTVMGIFEPFGILPSVLFSSALFAAIHPTGSWIYAFVWGLFLSRIALSHGIKRCIALHTVINAANFILALLQKRFGFAVSVCYIVLTVIFGTVSIAVLIKRHFAKRGDGNG